MLNYTLDGDIFMVDDENAFAIDQATGQITTAVALNYEPNTATRIFTVTVRATDSAGGATDGTDPDVADDATVTITLLDVNEPPAFEPENRAADNEANLAGIVQKAEGGVGVPGATRSPHTWCPTRRA